MALNATTLEGLIETGVFASQVERDIDRRIRRNPRETSYRSIRAAKGRAEAERELQEWVEERHLHPYGDSIEPVAHGIAALAKVSDSVIDITECTTQVYTQISGRNGLRHKFIAFNTRVSGCGCVQPKGSYLFGPNGKLGLRAVTLETGYGYNGLVAEMGLVLPSWGTSRRAPKPGDFVVIKFSTTGSSSGEWYSPYSYGEKGVQDFDDADAYLRHLLGMKAIDEQVNADRTFSDIDAVIGFPGAERYFAVELPKLGDYFVDLAKKLSTPHEH